MEALRSKYDRLADQFAVESYANLGFDMWHRSELAVHWKPELQPGDRILELGCGDGYLAELLAREGLRYAGLDLSPRMIQATPLLRSIPLRWEFHVMLKAERR